MRLSLRCVCLKNSEIKTNERREMTIRGRVATLVSLVIEEMVVMTVMVGTMAKVQVCAQVTVGMVTVRGAGVRIGGGSGDGSWSLGVTVTWVASVR